MHRHKRLSLVLVSFAISCSVHAPPPAPVRLPLTREERSVREAREAAAEIESLLGHYMTGLAPFELRRTARVVLAESARNRIDPHLVLAVMHTESGFYNFSRSPVGALGLMQIMPATGEMLAREAGLRWTGPDDLFSPELNVRLGTRYLALLHARYGTWQKALAAYNWGPAAIDRRLAEGDRVPDAYVHTVYARLASQ